MNQGVETEQSEDFLRSLQERFLQELPDKIHTISSLWDRVLSGEKSAVILREIHLKIHTLNGAGGTFGFTRISKQARELEILLKRCASSPEQEMGNREEEEISELLQGLRRLSEEERTQTGALLSLQDFSFKKSSGPRTIFIVEDDSDLNQGLSQELTRAGFQIRSFFNLEDFEKAFNEESPAAILMDMVFQEGDAAGARSIARLKERGSVPPVIFLSVREDMEARLEAVRAGAIRYYTKPVNSERLIRGLEGLLDKESRNPYRILVVDDDATLASFYASILRQVGMEVRILNNPLDCMDVIQEFQPELALLDVYMEGCSGLELAAVIRQEEKYSQLPVVFLSTETNLEKQLAAMHLGGDDFLSKPITPAHLIQAVQARMKRARMMAGLNRGLQSALQESEYRRKALDKHAIVSILDSEGKIVSVNEKFLQISGCRESELLERKYSELISEERSQELSREMEEIASSGNVWHGEICLNFLDGKENWLETSILPFLDDESRPCQYVVVQTDVTRRKETELSLEKSRIIAEKANQAKSEFLSSMSHELRTPLNAILGFGQLLELSENPPLSFEQANQVQEILTAGEHLLDLINEILDLSRIESGRVRLKLEPIVLNEIISECVQIVRPLANKRQIDIRMSLQEDACSVKGDGIRVKQIVMNLLSNAVKYNNEKGSIDIRVKPNVEGTVLIQVQDSGPGIPTEKQTDLFKPFNRLGAEQTEIEGTGIGLVISKKLIEQMGGRIGVESRPGRGSVFWFSMPRE